ncbi:MAG: RsmE family RNA methyltransferase [Treponema sp.]|nr:RsmE family RNA methyltransferase [Treponema sp.]
MRQFISEVFPDKKGYLVLSGKDFKYFRQVLRIKVGDMVSVRQPDGILQNMTACEIDDKAKKLTLQLCASTDLDIVEKELTRGVKASEINQILKTEYWLFQFLPKIQKLEQIVKQAVECGVSVIVPVIGEYTEKSSVIAMDNSGKMERLNKIIREARQQSGSPVDTKLYMPVSLPEACKIWKERIMDDEAAAFVLSERNEKTKSMTSALKGRKINVAALACGSEGGISVDEIERITQDDLFVPVHFEGNILRCETAALYGMAALQVINSQG